MAATERQLNYINHLSGYFEPRLSFDYEHLRSMTIKQTSDFIDAIEAKCPKDLSSIRHQSIDELDEPYVNSFPTKFQIDKMEQYVLMGKLTREEVKAIETQGEAYNLINKVFNNKEQVQCRY